MDYNELRKTDLKHLWHPYTHINDFELMDFPIFEHAEGVYIYDVKGRKILDGISSWWCVNLGHGQPDVIEAIKRQAEMMPHCILGGVSHPGVIHLAERLTSLAPESLTRAYFCGDGASATEAAMRMAIQYWYNRGRSEKCRIASLADGYHGDTLGAVGAGFVEAFHGSLRHVINPALRAASPHCFVCPARDNCDLRCFESMEELIRGNHAELAAVIVEPVCQGAAGMRIYRAEYLQRLRRLCNEFEVLLIADEIAVGFGRTGSMFACEYAGIDPDLMCVGKGLTAGYVPMSGVLTTESVYDCFRDTPDSDRTFYHGHTYCGNPLASAAALAALEVYVRDDVVAKSSVPAEIMAEGFKRAARLDSVDRVKTLGTMSSLRVTGGAAQARRTAERALASGLLIRPLGDILYLWPPLTVTEPELQQMIDILLFSLEEA